MIRGLGIDIEEVARFTTLLQRWGRQFTTRLFTDNEIAYCESKHRPPQHFAARFAAKEAFAKALGTGWRGPFAWKDIEIVNDANGKPSVRLSNEIQRTAGAGSIEISLSHTAQYVAAVVIIQYEDI